MSETEEISGTDAAMPDAVRARVAGAGGDGDDWRGQDWREQDWRGQIVRAERLLADGRQAAGVRLLRQATGALARRGAWDDAVRGVLRLARALRERGRPREAIEALCAIETRARAGLGSAVAAERAAALMALGRLTDAEAILNAVCAAPGAYGDAWLSLAECLFWRGEYATAAAHLRAALEQPHDPALAVAVRAAGVRVALGSDDTAAAARSADEAVRLAEADGAPRSLAVACAARALLCQREGDEGAATRAAEQAARWARRARDPLLVVDARLIAAESARRAGRPGGTRGRIRVGAGSPAGSLPPRARPGSTCVGSSAAARPLPGIHLAIPVPSQRPPGSRKSVQRHAPCHLAERPCPRTCPPAPRPPPGPRSRGS